MITVSLSFFTAGTSVCRKLLSLISVLLLVSSSFVHAQQPQNLKIHITIDNGLSLNDINVSIDYANNKTIGKTNEDGIFVAQIVPVPDTNTCKVSIHAFMYQSKDTTLTLSQTKIHEIRLNHLELQEVKVTGYKRIASTSANKTTFDIDRRGFPVNF